MAQNKKKKSPVKKAKKKSSFSSFKMNKQMTAIILFAVGILSFCLAVIDAEGLWGALRTLSFGLFGFCSFIFPLLLLVVSVFIAIDKTDGKTIAKIVEAFILLTILSSIVHIFQSNSASYFEAIEDAYNMYKIDGSMLGGGVWGALFGGIILLVTGSNKLAALIIAFLIAFVLVMIITNKTLDNLFKSISKPVKKIGEFTGEKITEYGEKIEQKNTEKEKLRKLAEEILQPIRDAWKSPIIVNSAFRSEAVNKAVGGVKNSQHRLGEAADITIGGRDRNRKLFNFIYKLINQGKIKVGQLIDEYNYSWIHVSLPRNNGKPNNLILHLR